MNVSFIDLENCKHFRHLGGTRDPARDTVFQDITIILDNPSLKLPLILTVLHVV